MAVPTIFCLHYLGGSAREWARVASLLEGRVRVVSIDLPGFGDAAATPGYTVSEMVTFVTKAVSADNAGTWTIAGHSMGAKVANAIARDAEDGAPELSGMRGLILVAGSPPSPEPMSDEQRAKMLGYFTGDAETSLGQARKYVASNSGSQLDPGSRELAEADALRANRAAWAAWLESGSREDWSERVGVLRMPALVVAGADDPELGPDGQRKFMLPHLANASFVTLPNAKHLLPMECGEKLARLMLEHVRGVSYRELIASNRVSTPTRKALAARDGADDPDRKPEALTQDALVTLRAIADRVVPQRAARPIDIAARIDKELACNEGDGWRFAALPSDTEAFATGLQTVTAIASEQYGAVFERLEASAQDRLLEAIASGSAGAAEASPDRLNTQQLRLWFEDLRAAAVRAYLGHPDILARIGYSGVANGGDGLPKSGFALTHLGEREAWEPTGISETAR